MAVIQEFRSQYLPGPEFAGLAARSKGPLMASDRNAASGARGTCIDPNESFEIDYWSAQLGVSTRELRQTIEEVGTRLQDILLHLHREFRKTFDRESNRR